jgi:2-polyprenyl-3-methyl-5-hydroxy-6-metoxy-1,4-benzoquinol methylase
MNIKNCLPSVILAGAVIGLLGGRPIAAQDARPREADYYRITSFTTPAEAVLEAGAFNLMSDGRLAVATRRGEIWMITDPLAATVGPQQFKRFAHGLHEPLGLAERDGWLYVTQRSDVSRLRDTNGDGEADEYQIVADGWEISGDYHEYAFGSKFDRDGRIWVALCLTGSFSSEVPFRGWAMRVSPEGETLPTTYGLRSPGGIGFNQVGDVFYTDNQGPWNGTCGLKQLVPGKFVGHPGGNRWLEKATNLKGRSAVQPQSDSRMMTEAAAHADLVPTAVLFPYNKMGQSASGLACDTTGGKFGPFTDQLFVGEQTHSTIMRVDLEMVDILDLGTGTARIPIELCKHVSDCRVMASDGAISMLEVARYNVSVNSMDYRIQLHHGDAKQLQFDDSLFDTVISNSLIHHVPEPARVIAEIVRLTKPGGYIFVRDLCRPASLDAIEELVARVTGRETSEAQQMFRQSLQAALNLDEMRSLVVQHGLPAEDVRETSDRHWTWCSRKP